MGIEKRFSESCLFKIRSEIQEAFGNEVFFVGKVNEDNIVVSVQAFARGNVNSVPVNLKASKEGSVLIHNHPSGNLHPSDADLNIAGECSERAQGFYIINNDASDIYAVMEPIPPKKTVKLEINDTADYLSNGGSLSKITDSFEERLSQIELVKKITESFNENAVGVFEAGTGVGKSFAYLIPSMLWALSNKERVVISTGTINLQQQLSEKDIPLAEKIIGRKVNAVLVKGRQNYICLRRLSEAVNDRELFSEDIETLEKLSSWAKESENGSRSDLSFNPGEALWQRVNSEADACMGMKCAHREKCFVMKMRKMASDANILVVNHHMLFADIESRMEGAGYDDTAVLPPYKRIVFDEAHGIESAATSFFSNSLNRFRILKQLNLLYRQKKNSVTGFLYTLSALSRIEDRSADAVAEIEEIKKTIERLESAAQNLLGNSFNIRLFSADSSSFAPVFKELSSLNSHLVVFNGIVHEILEGIDDDDKDNSAVYEGKSVLRRLEDAAGLCKNFLDWSEHPELVFWIQARRLSSAAAKKIENPLYYEYISTPLDIAPMMNAGVFEPMDSVVCTSATIGIGGKFDFWKKRSGVSFVENERLLEGAFASPFPYKENMIFAVPSDAPFPDNENFQTYMEEAVVRLIKAAGGKTLVLFTSYDSLRHACDTARTALRSSGIQILKQGDDDRFRLLSLFKNDKESVLFATDSFWEGVDVPGESLSQVIIVKLPFGVPSDPVFAARSEEITKRGGYPFMELSVPEAVIKFRQGFGRLIRRGDDRGAVIVLDRRIIEKPYGRIFTSSIPETKRLYKELDVLLEEVSAACIKKTVKLQSAL